MTAKREPNGAGRAVRGSSTGRPVMAAMDLFGRRWALRVMWEMRSGQVGARALLARIEGMSSSVLYERLRDLTDARLVAKTVNDEYRLTKLGGELGAALQPLDTWARRWARATDDIEGAEGASDGHE